MTDPTMRNTTFRGLLSVHRQVLREDVHRRIRDGRTERPLEGQDDIDRVDADIADDVEYAVLQMTADTLSRVEQALGRLDAGGYGCCTESGAGISAARLRALPFALRCTACEQRRESGPAPRRRLAQETAGPQG
jgi:DnaK suppressor protein